MLEESEQVRALKLKYRSSLNEKAGVINGYHRQLSDEFLVGISKNSEVLNDISEFLHKLAGSTGMYGFNKISSHCRAAMELVQQKKIDELIKKLKKIKKHLRKASEL